MGAEAVKSQFRVCNLHARQLSEEAKHFCRSYLALRPVNALKTPTACLTFISASYGRAISSCPHRSQLIEFITAVNGSIVMLIDLYKTWRAHAPDQALRLGKRFFAPLLVHPPAEWSDCSHRIAYVGQETMGWGWTKEDATRYGYVWDFDEVFCLGDFINVPTSVDALLESYRQFNFAASQPYNFNSPFWRYFRRLKELVAADGKPTSALFTNVIRCSADNEAGFSLWTVPEADRQEFLGWQTGLLKAELAILNPTLIIFLSGPSYDGYLSEEFSGLKFESIETYDVRVAAKLSSPDLPAQAFRTYHPGYLNRSIGFGPLEAIANMAR